MTAFYDDLTDRFREVHADLAKVLDGLTTEALDWIPGTGMNSVSVLIVHLVAAERYWIGAVALGEPTQRVREDEFEIKGLGRDELKRRLDEADEFTKSALARFSPADLEALRKSPRNEKTFRVGWCLTHALEHSALHLGHLQMTRQLWDERDR
ncbi:MAG TPA: DinB family protein [Anaerolineales bacterium]|nr:DinB family protein [Anaerolineales bacterium]